MSLKGSKILPSRRTQMIWAHDFNLRMPTLRVRTGTIVANGGLGVSAASNAGVLVGGTAVVADIDLLTTPGGVYAATNNVSVVLEEIAGPAVHVCGWKMNATNDQVRTLLRVPQEWDPVHYLRARAHFMTNSIVTTEVVQMTIQGMLQTDGATFDTTQDFTFSPAGAPGGNAYRNQVTAWATEGSIVNTWKRAIHEKPTAISLLLQVTRPAECTCGGDLWLMGVEIEYTPRL